MRGKLSSARFKPRNIRFMGSNGTPRMQRNPVGYMAVFYERNSATKGERPMGKHGNSVTKTIGVLAIHVVSIRNAVFFSDIGIWTSKRNSM